MRSVLAFTAATLVLSGCLLGKMEAGMDKTNAAVSDSNRLIGETKEGQQLGLALELMENEKTSTNLRVAATETVIKLAAEDRIGKYVGFPFPYDKATIPTKIAGRDVDFPNIAVIGHGIDPFLKVAMIEEELYEIQSFAALNMLRQIAMKSKSPGLTAQELDSLRVTTLRLIPVASGILGGAKAENIKAAYTGQKAFPYEKSIAERQEASLLIGEILRMLSLDNQDNKNSSKKNIESRLGVGVYW